MSGRNVLRAWPSNEPLRGGLTLPGDKSISHRSLMFGSIGDGTSHISGLLEGEDCLATLAAMRDMGVAVTRHGTGDFSVQGVGLNGLRPPASDLDLGNSGTAMRLLCGLLAAQPFASRLTGDASLSGRPMRRVTEPLGQMGARIQTVDGHAPIDISASPGLKGIDYDMPIASAQLKSALLIAGLYAQGPVTLNEPGPSRDHTERMLSAMGAEIDRDGARVRIKPAARLAAVDVIVPADLSSAAFFLVAGSIVAGSKLTLEGVGINPTRSGVLTILEMMGAAVAMRNVRDSGGEPVADLVVQGAQLRGATVPVDLVPLAIDEFPVLFVAAAAATGSSYFSGLAELRHKESDRISVMTDGLRALGVTLEEGEDWVRIDGGRIGGGRVDSHGDHRVAMAFAVAAAVASAPIIIEKPENIMTSFPNFVKLAEQCGLGVVLEDGAAA